MDSINFFIDILFIFFNELFSLIKLNKSTKTNNFFFSSKFHLQSDINYILTENKYKIVT